MDGCIAECGLNATGLYANGMINRDDMTKMFMDAVKDMPQWQMVIRDSLDECFKMAESKMDEIEAGAKLEPSFEVFITLSSLSRHIEDASVVINWGPDCESPPDWIGLYTKNPAFSDDPPVLKIEVNGRKNGEVITNQKFGKQRLPGGWSYDEVLRHIPKRRAKPLCFDIYLVSYNHLNKLQIFDCLKIQPNWMFTEKSIGNVSLKDLFLPGTHCSACYQTKANANNNLLKKVGFHQDLDIWTQLVFGVRYLDFSIGYHPYHNSTRNFWVMNEGYRVGWILPILHDIRRFVILSEETIVLDFRRFPLGFHSHPEQHAEFLSILDQELGDLAYRRPYFDNADDDQTVSYHLTIEDMRRQGKYILITYNHAASLNGE
ncbi:hypothetical protein quinque_005447 [Culex quinquefasciatus]